MGERIEDLAKRRNRLRAEVVAWMDGEGNQGRLRTNSQAPMWDEYERAENELARVISAVGRRG